MRNLAEYPITDEEVIWAIRDAYNKVGYEVTGQVGDIRPICLHRAIEYLRKDDKFQKWLEETQDKAYGQAVAS